MHEWLRQLREETDSLCASVGQLKEQQASVHSELGGAQKGLEELIEEEREARKTLEAAEEDASLGDLRLAEAETEVWRSLSRPAPFFKAELSGGEAPCALVSTLRGISEAELATWLSYHLDGCGFSRAFLFFDDPAELECGGLLLERWQDQVVAKPVNDQLRELYKACTRYDTVEPRLKEDWLARQELHVEIAMGWARADGCQWLLHIDLDELFLLGGEQSAPLHFGAIPPETQAMQYLNHEGVPELPEEPGAEGSEEAAERLRRNRFEAVTLFRRNPHCFADVPGLDDVVLSAESMDLTKSRGSAWQRRLDTLAQEAERGADNLRSPEALSARRALAFWPRRTRSALGSAQYFLAYASGKGAVRLGSGPPPSDVHRFGTEDLGRYWSPEEAAVLHYANGSYEAVEQKLRRLQGSSGSWWRSFVFYERGRDMEEGALYDLYRRGVALCDPAEAERQVRSGVCLRYSVPEGHLPAWQLQLLD